MEIISHRGLWCNSIENFGHKHLQNKLKAFKLSLMNGYCIETDIKNHSGDLVISHNPVLDIKNVIPFRDLCDLYLSMKSKCTLALNIKECGLHEMVKNYLDKYGIDNYFVFDMSIPDTLDYANNDVDFFLRSSEYETSVQKYNSKLYEKCSGIWVDSFEFFRNREDCIFKEIEIHIKNNKKVCIVSPELHPWGRKKFKNTYQYSIFWDMLKKANYKNNTISLCTDFPEKADMFFN